jgi:hypothetical protein
MLAQVAGAQSGDAPPSAPHPAPGNAPAQPDAFPGVPVPEHATGPGVDYTLRASLDPTTHTIKGSGQITVRNTTDADLHELWVHLYMNAFKNADSRFLREPVGPFRGGGSVQSWGMIDVTRFAARGEDLWKKAELSTGRDTDETDVRVPLPFTVQKGGVLTIDVEFLTTLPSVVERTGFWGSYHFAGQWFPKIAKLEPTGTFAHFAFTHLTEFYANYGTYDVTVDVPSGFLMGATGPIVEQKDEGGRHTERHLQSNIHDFAFTAWDQFERSEQKVDGVNVTLLYPRGMQHTMQRELDAVSWALPHFSSAYGRYPYPVLTVVHPPDRARETGGMEYPTLITTGGPHYLPDGFLIGEEVTVHELGHQWFYGLVGSNENRYPFLDEGLNSFAEEDAMAAHYGPGSVVNMLDLQLSDIAVQAVSSRFAVHDDPVNLPADEFATGFNYGRLVYGRTATVLETLRRTYGREPTMNAMGLYTRKERFSHPTPDVFYDEIEKDLGEGARAFAEQALNSKGWVDYVVLSVAADQDSSAGVYDRDGKRETVQKGATGAARNGGSALIGRRGTLSLPVIIELTDTLGQKRRVNWDGKGEHYRVHYDGDAPLAYVVVDPDHAVLVDHNFLNNHMATSRAASPSAPRTFERAFYWAETLLSLVSP